MVGSIKDISKPDRLLASERAVVLGATGPTGIHLARALRARGKKVRVVSRSLPHLEQHFREEAFELVAANVLEKDEALLAVRDCDLVFDCIGLPSDRMQDHPRVAEAIARAIGETGGRCLVISSFWSYLPVTRLPLTESHPRTGGPEWSQLRRQAEDILLTAGAGILHLPDFFGPHVHTSTLQQALHSVVRGKGLQWLGSEKVRREYVYVPDAMEIAADLALHSQAYRQQWVIPSSGPISGREVCDILARFLGRKVRLRSAGPFLIRLLSLFKPDLRGFLPMLPHYLQPISFDGSKIRGVLDHVETTPYEKALPATVDWIRNQSGS